MASIAVEQSILLGGAAGEAVGPSTPVRGSMTETPVLEMLSDAEVMLRVAAGDDRAFDYLVEKFRRPMNSFMYRMTRNQASPFWTPSFQLSGPKTINNLCAE